jgi:hypothetical protein
MQKDIGVSPGPIYEYSCHEGNYAMEGVLSGARAKEREDGNRDLMREREPTACPYGSSAPVHPIAPA